MLFLTQYVNNNNAVLYKTAFKFSENVRIVSVIFGGKLMRSLFLFCLPS